MSSTIKDTHKYLHLLSKGVVNEKQLGYMTLDSFAEEVNRDVILQVCSILPDESLRILKEELSRLKTEDYRYHVGRFTLEPDHSHDEKYAANLKRAHEWIQDFESTLPVSHPNDP